MVVLPQQLPGRAHAQSWQAHWPSPRRLCFTLGLTGRHGHASTRLAEQGALRIDASHQVVPGLDERFGAFVLEPHRKRVDIDTRLGEARQNRFAVASVWCKDASDLAVILEGLESALRHGVDREGGGE